MPLLQERQKWLEKRRNLKEGDIVLIVDERAPRGSWLMGKVEKTIPDANGFVRRVLVKTKTSASLAQDGKFSWAIKDIII